MQRPGVGAAGGGSVADHGSGAASGGTVGGQKGDAPMAGGAAPEGSAGEGGQSHGGNIGVVGSRCDAPGALACAGNHQKAVSYTHLTLPTNREV